MILCVGEILADMIGFEKDGGFFYERKAGGAPFNVACAAKKLGANVTFAGSVGDDLIGKFLVRVAENRGFDELVIEEKNDKNTTLAFVELSDDGERNFCFYRKNTADVYIPNISNELISRANVVHIGSLMLSEEAGRAFAEDIITRAHKQNKKVSFDVNFRTDIFRDAESALKIYKNIIKKCDIIKFSEDEVALFTEEYVASLKNKIICVSLGGAGSRLIFGGKHYDVKSIKVKPVDTTGAGDAFFGGFLSRFDALSENEITADKLCDILKFANVCGALNTLGRGAIDFLPDRETVENRLKEID